MSKKINTINLTAVQVYKLILDESLKIFPKYFWDKPDSLKEAGELTRYLIDDILKWDSNDVKNNLDRYVFGKNKLGGMLVRVFSSSTYNAINNAYPNKYLAWELKFTPQHYWNVNTAKKATKWLIEEKLIWDYETILIHINARMFNTFGLGSMLQIVHNGSPYLALKNTYPANNWESLKDKKSKWFK